MVAGGQAVRRPLRSVLIGDVDHYPSEFAFGVNQAMTRAGHWHTTVNIRQDIGTIAKRVGEMLPDVIWGHMLLWAPGNRDKTPDLLDWCVEWRSRGARVLLHDGDARDETRFPTDISPAVDLALCNHTASRSAWKVPQLHWPYFAFDQAEPAEPDERFRCDLLFAGRLDSRPLYLERTELVLQLAKRLGHPRFKVFGDGTEQHTVYLTPTVAASAGAVLGYGRPGRNGWLDVRVFQYPGAGGVLIHNDVGGYLEPWIHYAPLAEPTPDAVLWTLDQLQHHHDARQIRELAFEYVQAHHSATARVEYALAQVGLALR